MPNITKLQHEKLLAAAAHERTETARAEATNRSFINLTEKYEDLKKSHGDALAQLMTLKRERDLHRAVSERTEALAHLALRLSFHGDPEPIAGTE